MGHTSMEVRAGEAECLRQGKDFSHYLLQSELRKRLTCDEQQKLGRSVR